MGIERLFKNGVWVVEDCSHDGISIKRRDDGRYVISAWAENWDDLWSWEAEISQAELESVVAEPANAGKLLLQPRSWRVRTPSSVPRGPYVKQGLLDDSDGFMDGGTGGKA